MERLNKTGMAMLDAVPWGSHLCQFYRTPADLLEMVIPFFAEGLKSGDGCIWILSDPLSVQEASEALGAVVPALDEYLAKGQLEIVREDDWYFRDGALDAERILSDWARRTDLALSRGFHGLRASGNVASMSDCRWNDLVAYESRIQEIIGQTRMIALCTYSLEGCSANQLLDVVRQHDYAIVRRNGIWEGIESTSQKRVERELRRRAEEALQESHGRCRALVEGVDVGISLIDSDHHIVTVNKKQAEIVGRTPEELIGKKCYQEYEERPDVCPDCPGTVAMSTGQPAEREAAGTRRDGREYAVRLKASPMCDAGGKITGFVEVIEDVRQRKLQEEKIAWLASFPAEDPNAVLRIGPDGILQYSNPAGKRLLEAWGCQEGQRLPQVWHQHAMAAIQTQGAIQTECELDRQVYSLTFAATKSGESVNLYALDISDRKHAESALAEREEVYSTIVNQAVDGIVLIDATTLRFVEFNDAACQGLGYTREEFAALRLTDIQAFLSSEEVEQRVRDGIEAGGLAFDQRHRRKDGTLREVRISNRVVRIRGRVYLSAIWADITEEKRSQEALRASEEKYRTYVEGSPVGIFVADADGRYLEVNEMACRMTGFSREELTRMSIPELCDPSKVQETLAKFQAVKQQGYISSEICLRRKDGNILEVTLSAVRLSDDRFLGFCQDITSQRQTERALAEARQVAADVVERIPAGLFVYRWEAEDRLVLVDANPYAQRVTGVQLDEWRGHEFNEIWPEARAAGHTDRYLDVMRTGCPIQSEEVPYTDSRLRIVVVRNAFPLPGNLLAISFEDITARRCLEEAHRKTQERFQKVIETAPDAIVILTPEKDVLSANPASVRLFGCASEAELASLSTADLSPTHQPDGTLSVAKARQMIARTLEDGTHVFDWIYQRTNGELFPATVWLTRMELDGEPQLQAIIRDNTEREKAEQALRASEEKFRATVESAPEAIFIQTDGRFAYVNPAAVELFGAGDAQELLGRSVIEQFHPDYRDLVAERIRQLNVDRQTVPLIQEKVLRCDGTAMDVEVSAVPFTYQGKEGALVFAHDITERKQSEEQLRKLSQAVEQSPASIVITDTTGTIEYVNPRLTEVTGYTLDEVRGRTPRIFKSGEMSPEQYRQLWQTIASGRQWRGELHNKKKNGQLCWEFVSISPIVDESGHITHFLAVREDITERKRAEEELVRAKAAAESANRMKSEFVANISHEIRTPMTAILGFSDLLMTPDLSDEHRREFLETIHRNGQTLLQLINDLLDLSRIESGALVLNRAECMLPQLLEDVLSTVRVPAKEKGLRLDVDYAASVPVLIHTDGLRLKQILSNLVGNAVKFTRQGSVRITLRSQRTPENRLRLDVAVSDTGIGIPAEKLGGLFQPFTQVDGSSTRTFGGTGLGLAISQRLAEALDGQITVTSQAGRGSTFTLSLDAGRWENLGILATGFHPEDSTGRTIPQRSLAGRVLVVEDVPAVQKVVSHVLGEMNLDVQIAENGLDACRMAEDSLAAGQPYDLILMDIQLPEMNGYDATAWLRQQGWQRPIVAMTAHAMVGDREKCLAAGCDAYLSKPIDLNELLGVLRRYLNHDHASASDASQAADTTVTDPLPAELDLWTMPGVLDTRS